MQKINVGIIGIGTVGGGVVELLSEMKELISKRKNLEINLKYLVDKNTERLKRFNNIDCIKTSDYKPLLSDKELDIIVELVGGTEFAQTLCKEALLAGKNIVTANKALLAEKGEELFEIARKNKKLIGFEGSVCGGIPIIRTICNALASDQIHTIYGIVNGTTNYILTKMYEENISFENALKEAQRLGFAEADPTLDISGVDAAHKITILARIAFNSKVDFSEVYIEGIKNLQLEDIRNADELGYIIKLLAIAKLDNDNFIEVRVHPCLVSKNNQLAFVKNEYNAVMLEGKFLGDSMYYGKGAGAHPTATAIVSDIIEISKNICCPMEPTTPKEIFNFPLKNIGEIESRYYVRFLVPDKPGVLSKISGIFGKHNISIASVIQKERSKEDYVPLIMTTHTAKEKDMVTALNEIEQLDFSRKRGVMIRLIDD